MKVFKATYKKYSATARDERNAPNFSGGTALHITAREENERIVKYLIRQGSDFVKRDLKNREGQTALQVAVGESKDTLSNCI